MLPGLIVTDCGDDVFWLHCGMDTICSSHIHGSVQPGDAGDTLSGSSQPFCQDLASLQPHHLLLHGEAIPGRGAATCMWVYHKALRW